MTALGLAVIVSWMLPWDDNRAQFALFVSPLCNCLAGLAVPHFDSSADIIDIFVWIVLAPAAYVSTGRREEVGKLLLHQFVNGNLVSYISSCAFTHAPRKATFS